MKKILLVLMVFVLAACSAGNQSEIAQNQEQWRDAGVNHYRFNLHISCFCIFVENMPLIIEVRDGEVVSMEYQTGKPIEAENQDFFARFATIDRLFAELEAGLGGDADEVSVSYDPTYGFPVDATIDYVKEATDDELYLNVSGFEALP